MFYSEACGIALDSEATLDELLEAFKIIAIEHGYCSCILAYNLRPDENYNSERISFLKSLGTSLQIVQTLMSKIKEKKLIS